MDKYEELEKLQKLKECGAVTEKEFEVEKYKILNNISNNYSSEGKEDILRKIADKEQTSGVIWIVIGVLQVIIGLCGTIIPLFVGIWNIYNASLRMKYAKNIIKRQKDLVKEYNNNLSNCIIFLIINIFVGGIIGIVGAIYDLYIRNYVLDNQDKLR